MSLIKFRKKKRRKEPVFSMTVAFLGFKEVYTKTIKEHDIEEAYDRIVQRGVRFLIEGESKLIYFPPHRVKLVTLVRLEGEENGKKDGS